MNSEAVTAAAKRLYHKAAKEVGEYDPMLEDDEDDYKISIAYSPLASFVRKIKQKYANQPFSLLIACYKFNEWKAIPVSAEIILSKKEQIKLDYEQICDLFGDMPHLPLKETKRRKIPDSNYLIITCKDTTLKVYNSHYYVDHDFKPIDDKFRKEIDINIEKYGLDIPRDVEVPDEYAKYF